MSTNPAESAKPENANFFFNPFVTGNWHKFKLLMWKNWLLQKRHRTQTIVEILAPVLFASLLVIIRSLVKAEAIKDTTRYPPVELTLDGLKSRSATTEYEYRVSDMENLQQLGYPLAFTPNTSQPIRQLVEAVATQLGISEPTGFASHDELEKAMYTNRFLAGLEFGKQPTTTTLAKRLRYSIRFPSRLRTAGVGANPVVYNWRTSRAFPPFQTTGPRSSDSADGGTPPGYWAEGFLAIQNAVATVFLKTQAAAAGGGDGTMPAIQLQRFPYPPYVEDKLLTGLENIVSLLIMLCFVYPAMNTVRFIAAEKEAQLKEAMKIMGMPNWLHWTGWFLRSIMYMSISITLIVILLTVSWTQGDVSAAVFTHSSRTALWLFLFVYSIATIAFCAMLSVFFARANTAAAVSGLCWFLSYVAFTFTSQSYEDMTLLGKMMFCMLHNTGMAFGFQLIIRWEGNGDGLLWKNFFRRVSVDDSLTVGLVMLMLLFTAAVYFLVALYVEKVYPGEFGVPEHWSFPFRRSFWCPGEERTKRLEAELPPNEQPMDEQHFEPEPVHLHAGVRVHGLLKKFGARTAVSGMYLNMYDDQITVLLGHNGAGKSTTMALLTGLLRPTAGTALVNDFDVCTELAESRGSLGLCPQYNILFDELTVEEHIVFFSSLKGMPDSLIPAEVDKYLALIKLEAKRKAQSRTLSGGMKRKLSVCVAFCGGSRVVLCDEPTSGMDPAARRAMWDVLQREKKGRTVLLTTHFMDEADVLGDRIAIMANGHVECCGSSYFLKKRFGAGYFLVCVKLPHCRPDAVTAVLRSHCGSEVRVHNNVGTELSYQLADTWSDKFPAMFVELENRLAELGLSNFGMSLTTLEEVFMAVGTEGKDVLKIAGVGGEEQASDQLFNSLETVAPIKGPRLIVMQVIALLQKKLLQTMRSWLMLVIQVVIPATFVITAIMSEKSRGRFKDLPAMKVDFGMYHSTMSMLQTSDSASMAKADKYATAYHEMFDNGEQAQGSLSIFSTSMEAAALAEYEHDLPHTNRELIVGATLADDTKAIAWFNNQPYHGAVLSLWLVHEAVLHALLGSEYGIDLTNAPIPYDAETRDDMVQLAGSIGFQLAINTSFAMAFVMSFYVLPYIRERVSGSKHLQIVSGARVVSYWMTAYFWDLCTFMFTVLVLMIVFAICRETGWSSISDLWRLTFVLWTFAWSVLPYTYVASNLFSQPASGYTYMALYYVFTGMALFSITFILALPEFDLGGIADRLTWIFMIFPHYALSHCMYGINLLVQQHELCQLRCDQLVDCNMKALCVRRPECCHPKYFVWKSPGVGLDLFYMNAVGVIALAVLLLLDYRVFHIIRYRFHRWVNQKTVVATNSKSASSTNNAADAERPPEQRQQPRSPPMDDDVLAEKQRVFAMTSDQLREQNLVIRSLTRDYGTFRAVNQLSLCIGAGECFGLLGINGAGKTTTFGMLTGVHQISGGNAWVRGLSLRTQMAEVQKCIGYCPQFDGVIGELTGRETLRMFCALRGIEGEDVARLTRVLADELGFKRHLDKPAGAYSGGNRRKLSVAVALVGNPLIVYLDEPTTGMDPNAKRCLWNVVAKVRRMGKTIVLTSHSMDECEALCTRLAIMVAGVFRCLGGLQHLKSKFAAGYTLVVKLRKPESKGVSTKLPTSTAADTSPLLASEHMADLKRYIHEKLPCSRLDEEFQEQLTYQVGRTVDGQPDGVPLKWSTMFGIMETAKGRFKIEDYAISQTSLEQVFLTFARQQEALVGAVPAD